MKANEAYFKVGSTMCATGLNVTLVNGMGHRRKITSIDVTSCCMSTGGFVGDDVSLHRF